MFVNRDRDLTRETSQTEDSLTFALVGGVGSQGVAIETVSAAVTEESVGVVDALQALSCLPVAVADCIGVNVVTALAGAAGPDRPSLTQGVTKETVIAEFTALTCRQETEHLSRTILKFCLKLDQVQDRKEDCIHQLL